MSRVTRFPARAGGPAARLSDFIDHLRLNGFALGPGETGVALAALTAAGPPTPQAARMALRAVCVANAEQHARFDDLFDAFWLNRGRARPAPPPRRSQERPTRAPQPFAAPADGAACAAGAAAEADDGDGAADAGGEGRLAASLRSVDTARDLRAYADPESLAEAERIAGRLAKAIRDRRSRRHRAANRGGALDLRRTLRASLQRGGEPIDLRRRRRPDRPMRIVCLLDVSGSMEVHARVFLAFLRGLMGAQETARAWLFHTRLIDATPALTDRDRLRAADRLSLMAQGFGGGTRLAGCLHDFVERHAAKAVNRRTVVVILSDGCDAAPAGEIGAALARLRRRAGRIVWLNPLKGWRDYAPTAAAMAAALPHLDAFLPAATLDQLAALEGEFARL
ncbi:vWA domain-containing protein [Rubrimonas cliftonensis]|uniref:Uncharacterized conserved protein, contains von Willebrand factor type A (VWA) domain n=1 Tax=Rubrimonas cliftonensis TaxID=89524 RepID=A0A1H4F469_9RHOB|nr:VWA domain-containing protein [Rubrimonas cliftonensis]SEA91740.1 Uncharacterized conserved protein, contains von Willebrand factor type A (vWA) domain [Rubrimonas cliftonensis]